MNGDKYIPNGEIQGDTRSMPDRGQSTGVTDTYGANLTGVNRMGGMGNAAKSDSPFDNDADGGKMDGDE